VKEWNGVVEGREGPCEGRGVGPEHRPTRDFFDQRDAHVAEDVVVLDGGRVGGEGDQRKEGSGCTEQKAR
jgi:hypothetical protein